MKVLSLFDGISCGRVALERAGIPVDRYVAYEIDKYAIQVSSRNYPTIEHRGDVVGADFSEFAGFDLLIGGSPCFIAGTKVLTNEGHKNIEDITVGDLVLTHRNRFRRVSAIGGTTNQTYKLSIQNNADIYTTAEHPFYIRRKGLSKYSKPSWKRAIDIQKGDYVGRQLHVNDSSVNDKRNDVIIDNIMWLPFITREEDVIAKVYNIGVDEDESYTANNIIVHNCQDLSIASREKHGLKGERSGLFYEYIRALEEVKPRYFILENVASMTKENKKIISEALGVEPILINSSLVSAQQRKRLYWTNIPVNDLPQDKGIILQDILESSVALDKKAYTLTSSYGCAVFHYTIAKKRRSMVAEPLRIGHIGKGGQGDRIYSVRGKSVCLSANGGGRGAKTGLYKVDLPDGEYVVRKLTPIECERLQTLPDDYTAGISNTQRYKCLGNGWTVDVIAHILKYLVRI